jgi:hypothetical protein
MSTSDGVSHGTGHLNAGHAEAHNGSSRSFLAVIAATGESAIPSLIKATEMKIFGGMPMLSVLLDSRPGLKKALETVFKHTARPLMFAIAGVSCFFVAVRISIHVYV